MKLAERTFNDDSYTKPKGRSLYGWRINPVTNKQQFHYGEDYSTQGRKLPLFPLENGIVRRVGFNDLSGNFVEIDYPRVDLRVFYAHLDVKYVMQGQLVTHDKAFGLTGTTGSSTGIHLHMGVKRISTDKYFNHANFDYQEHYINGVWNEQFTRDLQTYFETTVDGIISGQNGTRKNIQKVSYGLKGSQMVKALQRKLGHTQSGQLDKSTIIALQRALGLIPDGIISPVSRTVRILQNRLSEGWLL